MLKVTRVDNGVALVKLTRYLIAKDMETPC